MPEQERPFVEDRQSWLEGLGYQIAWRQDGWHECLVEREDERWLGRGLSLDSALAAALDQMLPSHAARSALEAPAAPEAPDTGGAGAPRSEALEAPPAPEAPDTGGAEAPRSEAEAETEAVEETEPWSAGRQARLSGSAGLQTRPAPEAPGTSGAEAPRSEAPRFVAPSAPSIPIEQAHAALEALEDCIETATPELALMSPERQRLIILSWIARGRALEVATGGEPEIERRVASLARQLTQLCKLLWPGSIRALQLQATPESAAREFRLHGEERVWFWDEVVTLAEARQREWDTPSPTALDEYGWADERALKPPPGQPDEELRRVRGEVEALLGSLTSPPPARGAASLTQASPEEQRRFVGWARRTRWLRGSTSDFLAWGQLVGRLRWLSAQRRGDEALSKVIDPSYRPELTWAKLTGKDPADKERKRRRKELSLRQPTVKSSPEELIAWLGEALAWFSAAELLKLLRPAQAFLEGLDTETVGEISRSARRRLRKLIELRDGGELPEDAEEDEAEDIEEDLAPEGPDPLEELIDAVRPRTQGRRALFVSNRNDPELTDKLIEIFGFSELEGLVGAPRQLQSAAERVSRERYDMVLCATGFQSHSADDALFAACKKADIPYVRVNRGRPLAAAQALARSFGLSAGEVFTGSKGEPSER